MPLRTVLTSFVWPRWIARLVGLGLGGLVLTLFSGSIAARPALAAGTPCSTTTTLHYTLQVCLTQPGDGSTVTGTTTVAATFAVLSGTSRVQQMVFSLDDKYLLTDFQRSPESFTISSQRWVDGPHKLSVYASVNDNTNTSASPAFIYLTFANGVTTPPVNTNTRVATSGSTPPPGSPVTVVATGDGAGGDPYTASVVNQIAPWSPNLLLYLGDVYQNGSYSELQNWYDPTFGQYRSITDPVVGNHEYSTFKTSAPDYFDYWDNLSSYYSFDAGGWHFIALNSNATALGATGPAPNGWTTEKAWLQSDLNAHPGACIVAYWHHPAFNIGPEGQSGQALDFWNMLYPAHATLILNGHDHTYQRWQPVDANGNVTSGGITEIIAGTGGHAAATFTKTDARVVASKDGVAAFGALQLKLGPTSLDYKFIQAWGSSAGTVFDSGSLPCQGYGTLSGTVTDGVTGKAVAGATVSYGSTSTTTSATGVYTLSQAPLNSYGLTAAAASYSSQAQTVTVLPGKTTSQNFVLAPLPGSISGTVSDGVTGRPISGASVADGALSAATDVNGNFALTNLTEGTHALAISAPGYASQSATVALGPGASVSQSVALNPLPGVLAGQVTDAVTAQPVPVATVSYTAGGATNSAITDANGKYALSGVIEGSYSITAGGSGYVSQTVGVSVGPAASMTQNWSLSPLPGSISGRVTDATTGLAASGATVSYGAGGVTVSATSDLNGNYTLSGVQEGSYTVTASGSGFASQWASVTVGPGSAVTQNYALVPLAGTISGKVTDAGTAASISGASVTFTAAGVARSATTDASGMYSVSDVPAPGTYALTVIAAGYSTQTASVPVNRGGVATANFAMQLLPGSITGQVTDARTAAPINGATVSYVVNGSAITSTTDGRGNYILSNVPPGSYAVTGAASGYNSQAQTLIVITNAATAGAFALTPLPGSIAGQVTDGSTGRGIAGATVAYSVGSVTTTGITDANGNYGFTSVAEGSYNLTASAPGYSNQAATAVVGAGAATIQNFALPLLPGSIAGQVTDSSTGIAIGGTSISYTSAGTTTATTTDANGNYSLTGLAPATYSLTASAAGYTPQGAGVVVATNATTTQNFALAVLPGAIAGTIRDSHTAAVIGGATVSYATGGVTTKVTADAGGAYRLANVPPGTYTVTASATGYAGQSIAVSVTTNATTTQNFSLAPQDGSIAGRVTDAGNGAAIPGATVSFVASQTAMSATADAAGSYTFAVVPQGTYTLTAVASNYGSQSQQVTVVPGGSAAQNFSLSLLPGSLRGQVTDNVTAQPINGATVAYTTGAVTTSATADASGNYTLAGVPPGSYTLNTTAPGYSGQSQTVVVSANAASTQNFSLAPLPGSISGRLSDSLTGKLIGGAMISYTASGVITTVTADANGNYAIANLTEGSYTLTGAASGYSNLAQSVNLGPGGAATANLALVPLPGSINGTVTDVSTGKAIVGAVVAIGGGSGTTNAAGAYSIANVTEGTYILTASANGYNSQTQAAVVGPGATAQKDFALLAPLFSDGFESGTLSAWTTNVGLVTEGTVVHAGSYAAEGSVVSGTTYARKTLPGTYQSVYARTYFNLKSQSGTVSLLGLRTSTYGAIAKVFVDASNRLSLRNEVTAINTTGPALTLNAWHSVELHLVIGGTSSTTELWLDGTLVTAFENTTANLGTVNVGSLQLGESSARTYDVIFDDVVVQTARIGL